MLRLKCLSEMSTFAVSLANNAFSQTAFLTSFTFTFSLCKRSRERASANEG